MSALFLMPSSYTLRVATVAEFGAQYNAWVSRGYSGNWGYDYYTIQDTAAEIQRGFDPSNKFLDVAISKIIRSTYANPDDPLVPITGGGIIQTDNDPTPITIDFDSRSYLVTRFDGFSWRAPLSVSNLLAETANVGTLPDDSIILTDSVANIANEAEALLAGFSEKIDAISLTDNNIVDILAGITSFAQEGISGISFNISRADILAYLTELNTAAGLEVTYNLGGSSVTVPLLDAVFMTGGFPLALTQLQYSSNSEFFTLLGLPAFVDDYSDVGYGYVLPTLYSDPNLPNLTHALIDSRAVTAVVGANGVNTFISLTNSDALVNQAADANGTIGNVIDGGVGSNFLTGDIGADVFFLDGRAAANTWSTVTDLDFSQGDNVTIWGWNPGHSSVLSTLPVDSGAEGYTGTTFYFADLAPDADALTSYSNPYLNSLTLTGFTLNDFGVNTISGINGVLDSLDSTVLSTASNSGDIYALYGNFTVGRIDYQWYLNIHQDYNLILT